MCLFQDILILKAPEGTYIVHPRLEGNQFSHSKWEINCMYVSFYSDYTEFASSLHLGQLSIGIGLL